jgi:hypothetical protein
MSAELRIDNPPVGDPDIERIAAKLRRSREVLERDMDDSATKINSAELLQRIEALRQRIEASQATFRLVTGNSA